MSKLQKIILTVGLLSVAVSASAVVIAAIPAVYSALSSSGLFSLVSGAGGALLGGVLTIVGGGFTISNVSAAVVGTALAGAIYGLAGYDETPTTVVVDNVGTVATNPDLSGTVQLSTTTTPAFGVVGTSNTFGTYNNASSSGTLYQGYLYGTSSIASLLKQAGYTFSSDFTFVVPYLVYSNAASPCFSVPNVSPSSYGGSACFEVPYTGTATGPSTAMSIGLAAIHAPSRKSFIFVAKYGQFMTSCPAGSLYSNSTCYADTTATLTDAVCRVSWNDSAKRYDVNPWDSDCVNVKLATSLPTSSSPASVSFSDSTGKSLNVQTATAPTQGITAGAGAMRIIESVPDYSNNTTTTRTTLTTPGTATAPPAVSGGTSAVYAGTGSAVGTTALSSVAISNWPAVMTVQGTVSCSNCAAGAGNITIPDKMKIDGEVPAAAPSDLPALSTSDFTFTAAVAPLRDRLKELLEIEVDPHSTTCPEIGFGQAEVFGHVVDLDIPNFCSLMESQRALLSAILTACAAILTILIILTA